MATFAERMNRMVPSGIRKVNEKALAMERAGEHVIHFEIGRPDFDTPKYVKKAAIEALQNGDVFYTSNFGKMELRQAIADKLPSSSTRRASPLAQTRAARVSARSHWPAVAA